MFQISLVSMSKIIEKKEIKYGLIGIAIILAWFLWLRPRITPFLASLHPFFAMLVYEIGLFVGILFISSVLSKGSLNWRVATITALIFIGFDIITAPYLVTTSGVILQNVELWFVSADVGFAALYSTLLPASLIWIFTYVVTPVILIIVIPILIGNPKQLAKAFTG